jgi:dTDP-4-amino-4,6-dideoxygalactose transaminase
MYTHKKNMPPNGYIPFNWPHLVGSELERISDSISRGHLSGGGYYTKMCHVQLEGYLNVPKVLLTHSCTGALEMAALLIDIEPGDEVIVPSYTFVSTASAFALRGAKLVFVDVDCLSMNVDVAKIEMAISAKTKAVCVVHYAGGSCDMDAVVGLCAKNNIVLIEDAAQALGSSFKGKKLGTFGALATFSFHETKNIISGEGGALVVNDPNLIERSEMIWEKGTNRSKYSRGLVDKYTWLELGSSFLPGEMIAAFLSAQLDSIGTISEHRRAIFDRYHSQLNGIDGIGVISHADGVEANGHLFYVVCPTEQFRTELVSYALNQRSVHLHPHYIPLHSSPFGLKCGISKGSMDVTNDISFRLLRLPLFFDLTEQQQAVVVRSILDFLETKSS